MARNRKKSRNLYAISAHFRNSAGAFKDVSKEEDKYKCREEIEDEWLEDDEETLDVYEEIERNTTGWYSDEED